MAIIAPGVCRFTVHGTFTGGNEVDNVLDMRIDTTGSTESREESIFNQAGIIINQWVADILPELMSSYSFDSVSWVDLNSSSGSVGSRTSSGAISLPDPGGRAGASMSSNVAQLASKNIVGRRGRRNGRIFFTAPAEADTSGNFLSAGRVTAWNAALDDFLGNINQDATGIFDFTSALVVVHTTSTSGEPVFTATSDVESLTMEPLLATQRRRLRD